MKNTFTYPDEDDFEESIFEVDPEETVARALTDLTLKEFKSSPEKRSALISLKEKELVGILYKEVLSYLPLHFTKEKFKERIKDIRLFKNEDIFLEGIKNLHFIDTLYNYCQTRNQDIKNGWLREFQFIKEEVSPKRIKLEEKYKKTTFPFLNELVDQVYESPRDIEEIFNSYGLDVKLTTFDPSFSEDAVCNATISKKKKRITIYLNTRFIVSSIFKGKNKELFKRELELTLVHENTHEQQFQNRVEVLNRFFSGDTDPNDSRGLSSYYSAPGEMDAFARELAFDLEENNIDPNSTPLKDRSYYVKGTTEEKIASFCVKNHLSRTSANILMAYNLYAPRKIINRFLKRVYLYLREED